MPRRRWITALLAGAWLLASGCSSDSDAAPPAPHPTSFTASDVSCGHDLTSPTAQDIIERVGGLVTPDFAVRFAKSTELGIVALVDGDTAKAFKLLSGTYGVALVATIDRAKDPGRIASFAQVRKLVAAACG